MGDSNKQYKGQTLIIDGSRSGADVPQSKISYNATGFAEYFGDAKFGVSEDASKWYIEKFIYDAVGNVTDCKTAVNQIYSGIATVTIDATSDPIMLVTITGLPQALLDILNANDVINLTTPANLNKLQGNITAIDKATGIFTVEVGAGTGIIDEALAVIGATDCIFILNKDEIKPFSKRVWSLRSQYIYQ